MKQSLQTLESLESRQLLAIGADYNVKQAFAEDINNTKGTACLSYSTGSAFAAGVAVGLSPLHSGFAWAAGMLGSSSLASFAASFVYLEGSGKSGMSIEDVITHAIGVPIIDGFAFTAGVAVGGAASCVKLTADKIRG